MSWPNEKSRENDHFARQISGIGVFLDQATSSSAPSTNYSNFELSTKDYSNPFYCKVCHIDCTGDASFESHINGKNHAKKLKQLGLNVKSEAGVKGNFALNVTILYLKHDYFLPKA